MTVSMSEGATNANVLGILPRIAHQVMISVGTVLDHIKLRAAQNHHVATTARRLIWIQVMLPFQPHVPAI